VFGVCQSSTWRGRKRGLCVLATRGNWTLPASLFSLCLCGLKRAARELNQRAADAAHHMPPSFASSLLATNGDWRMSPTVIVVYARNLSEF
jgi:hypothetical protein